MTDRFPWEAEFKLGKRKKVSSNNSSSRKRGSQTISRLGIKHVVQLGKEKAIRFVTGGKKKEDLARRNGFSRI